MLICGHQTAFPRCSNGHARSFSTDVPNGSVGRYERVRSVRAHPHESTRIRTQPAYLPTVHGARAQAWPVVASVLMHRCAWMARYAGGWAAAGPPRLLLAGICWLAAGYWSLDFRARFSTFESRKRPDRSRGACLSPSVKTLPSRPARLRLSILRPFRGLLDALPPRLPCLELQISSK